MNKISSISSFTPAVPEAKDRVERENSKKKDGQNQKKGSDSQSNSSTGEGSEESGSFRENLAAEIQVTDEKVGTAIEAFTNDAQSKSNGLSLAKEGSGPGLKVVLKDGSGAIVRQFSGEEFLKLRQAAAIDSKARGKILDKKV